MEPTQPPPRPTPYYRVAVAPPDQAARACAADVTPTIRVLVVEDHRDVRAALAEAVRQCGFQCVEAADGNAAWEEHIAHPADVILSDWRMPGVDGAELCRRVRSQAGERYTYFLFATALGDRDHMLRALAIGADAFLVSPVDLDELDARLAAAVRMVSHQRTLEHRTVRLRHDTRELLRVARVDPLTGVGNRLRLAEELATAQAQAARTGRRYCVALCDVDFFKRFNDRFGHLAGDEALRQVASAASDTLRAGDTIYRYGGEEFVLLLPDQGVVGAATAAERVRHAVAALSIPHREASPGSVLSISVGVAALVPGRADATQNVLARADAALYRAKARSRNCVETDAD